MPDATPSDRPQPGRTITVLHAPGHPELGGLASGSRCLACLVPGPFQPPAGVGGSVLGLYGLLGLFWIASTLAERNRAKARVVRKDCANGRILAARVDRLTAVREDVTGPGLKPGKAQTTTNRWLEARIGGRAVRLHRADPMSDPFLAAQLDGHAGWLLMATRWKFIKGAQPVAFVADEGTVIWAECYDVGQLPPQDTDPNRRVRLAPRVVHPNPAMDIAVPALLALLALVSVPALLSPDAPFAHPFLLGVPLLGGALAAQCWGWSRRVDKLPASVRRRDA
ncbi:hypothetical protein LN042_27860 [Kitasatospora sp. RB6PN24]|uniref:hypothetical protein n=1 Tax=Kitasatospora humi TaxID=2893891 RepID=UPI001E4C78E0|nr:hypothetical protein [Kitasatospora humi]MCC9310841.1 hypothetical protein [Kitasatospora humi]